MLTSPFPGSLRRITLLLPFLQIFSTELQQDRIVLGHSAQSVAPEMNNAANTFPAGSFARTAIVIVIYARNQSHGSVH